MGVKRKSRGCLSALILSAALQADGFLCFTGPAVGGGGSTSTAVLSMSSLNQASSTSRSSSSRRSSPPSRGPSALGTPAMGSSSRCRSGDLFQLNLSPYEEYMATRNKEAKGESVAPEQHEKASLFERYMKSREKQATLPPAEKEKSIFEEYSQSRPTPAAAPTEEVKELSPYEEYMEKRRRVEAAEAATTAEEKAKASLFKKYLAWRGLTAEEEAKAPKDERAAMFAKYLASRIKARVSDNGGRIGRWLAPLFKILPGGKRRAEKQAALQEADEASEDSDGDGDASECPDDSTMPINGEEVEGDGGYSRYNWSLDVEYTQEEKIAMFDDYMASREKVKAASAQVTPEEVETVSAYGEYLASRARKEAALATMAPEEKTRSLFEDYMASREPKKATARGGVLELTKSTFDAAVMDPTKHAFVYFSAPWCVHCQNLDEDFAELGKIFETQSNIVIAKVNAIEEKELKQRCGVKKYPTLQYYPAQQGGKVEVYTGARDVESMADFLDHMNLAGRKQPPPPGQQQQQKKKPPGAKHVGSGGMADTRDPAPVKHEDPRKSISVAPSFEEYLKSRQ